MSDTLTIPDVAEPTEFDTEYTRAPICPHCGKEMTDAWELQLHDSDYQEVECGWCEKPYSVTCCISVDYCTYKPEPT